MPRLFYALWPDDQVRDKLLAACPDWGEPKARPVHCQDLHMTLQFLGSVPSARVAAVADAASGLAAAGVDLLLTQLGCWPRPQVAWCGPDRTPAQLAALVTALAERLSAVGYPPEPRSYRPHVTLARNVRNFAGERLDISIRWRAREFVLIESLSLPSPPRYKVLRRYPLEK